MCDGSSHPADGSQPRWSAKTRIASGPSQYLRQRDETLGDERHHVVRRTAGPNRGHGAERKRDDDGDCERRERERRRYPQGASDLIADRHPVREGVPEVASRHVPDPARILHRQRPIEAVSGLEPLHRIRIDGEIRDPGPQDRPGRIAFAQVRQREAEHGDHQQRQDQDDEPAGDEGNHGVSERVALQPGPTRKPHRFLNSLMPNMLAVAGRTPSRRLDLGSALRLARLSVRAPHCHGILAPSLRRSVKFAG